MYQLVKETVIKAVKGAAVIVIILLLGLGAFAAYSIGKWLW